MWLVLKLTGWQRFLPQFGYVAAPLGVVPCVRGQRAEGGYHVNQGAALHDGDAAVDLGAERLALRGCGWEYVVSNEVGDPCHPQVLSRYRRDAVKGGCGRSSCTPPGIQRRRRCTWPACGCGYRGVDRAQDASLTMRLYAHSQDDALKAAGDTFNRVVTSS